MENTLKPNLDKTQWANWPILWSVFRLVCAVSILLFREQFLPYIHIFLRPCLMCSARSGWRWFPWAEASALMQSIAGGSLFQHFDGKQRCQTCLSLQDNTWHPQKYQWFVWPYLYQNQSTPLMHHSPWPDICSQYLWRGKPWWTYPPERKPSGLIWFDCIDRSNREK